MYHSSTELKLEDIPSKLYHKSYIPDFFIHLPLLSHSM